VELKKAEITDRIKESVEQNGKKPELFGDIVRAAVALLERLIAKVMQKVMEMAEKVIGKAATVEETPEEMPKESESHIQAEDEPIHQPEVKKLPFPFDHYRKAETQNQTEQPQQKSTATVKKSVPTEAKQMGTERPPKLQPSVLAAKYPRLKEIDDKLKEQNRAIFEREQKRDKLQKEFKFDSVQAFCKEFNAAKKEYLAYHAARAEWKKIRFIRMYLLPVIFAKISVLVLKKPDIFSR